MCSGTGSAGYRSTRLTLIAAAPGVVTVLNLLTLLSLLLCVAVAVPWLVGWDGGAAALEGRGGTPRSKWWRLWRVAGMSRHVRATSCTWRSTTWKVRGSSLGGNKGDRRGIREG